jgi:hypothetical protein
MIFEFDFTKAIFETGKILFNNLFTKKLTKEDIENIISKHKFGNSNISEKIIVVINENQELIYSENGEFQIKPLNIEKSILQELFIKMLIDNVKEPNEITDIEWEELPIPIEKIRQNKDVELIDKVKQKHKDLYGE